MVLVHTVAVVLAVGKVVLAVVADEVPQGKPIVAGQEVDRVARRAAGTLVEVGTAAQSRRQRRGHPRLAAPEATYVIAILSIPLRPARAVGETPHLVEPRRVPWLGDQLGVSKHAV